jgi:glycine/D-amino acid oxidase-like deaminating enzyme
MNMTSIWQENMTFPSFPTLRGDFHTDVLIIGGGIAGLLCARKLHDAGADYLLCEADTICSGITKNTTAKITSQHRLCYHKLFTKYGLTQAKYYLSANEAAVAEYQRLCATMDCNFTMQDHYVYSLTDRKKLEKELSALQKLGYCAEFTEKLPLPFPTAGAVKFPKQAQFHPLKFLGGITTDLQICEHTPIRQLGPGWATTDRGTIYADKIIVATHFPILNKHGSYFLKLYQHRSYCLALENVQTIPGMFVDEAMDGLSFRTHDGLLILGGGSHRTGKQGGGWEELEQAAREFFPGATIHSRWATQDCMSLDGIPYIGRYSARTADLFVATGFNKWGMTSSMVAANLLTDLVLNRQNQTATVFSPSRSILHRQLAINAFESITNLLTFRKHRCPHMGCALRWNPQEHSWDCPCHGSRFEENGRLIDNPATNDLES